MPPRYAYWTILAGGLPTAFRAAEREELMPTFRRIKDKHPDAEMKYFARGKLWSSPEEMRGAERGGARDPRGGGPAGPRRGSDWRPGGEHRDPRQQFKDAKRARNQDRRQERWDNKNQALRAAPPKERPLDAPQGRPQREPLAPRQSRPSAPKPNWRDRPRGDQKDARGPRGQSRPAAGAPRAFRPSGGRRFERNQEPPARPPGPDREPPPARNPKPEPPPQPSEPTIRPPGPPERGAPNKRRREE